MAGLMPQTPAQRLSSVVGDLSTRQLATRLRDDYVQRWKDTVGGEILWSAALTGSQKHPNRATVVALIGFGRDDLDDLTNRLKVAWEPSETLKIGPDIAPHIAVARAEAFLLKYPDGLLVLENFDRAQGEEGLVGCGRGQAGARRQEEGVG
jgi:hypothetical protein